MRFSTQMMYQQNMRGITNSQAEWMKYGIPLLHHKP